MAPKHSLDAGQIGCVYHHLPGTCCKNDSITAAKRNRVAKLNAVAAGVYGHNEVESDGGGTSLFQKSREPFQSGTRPFTKTNPVLVHSRATRTPKAPYNYPLVALSVLIAMFASYAALDLAGRVTAAGGWTRAVWLLGGAGAMGTGIWSMHYIGMLAFILPISVAYHWPTVLLSLFAAILASFIALYVVSRRKMCASRALAGSVLMGAGIASMHYIGMAAMRLPAVCHFNLFLVVLSVVFAVLISLAAP